MRSLILTLAAASLAGLAFGAGCNNESASPFAEVGPWQLQCVPRTMLPAGCQTGCIEGNMQFVNGETGDPGGVFVECSVREVSGTRSISLVAQTFTGGLELTGVRVPIAGGSASSGQVTVTEGANIFSGQAGSNTPSEGQPCQVSGVAFGRDEATGQSVLEGQLRCQFLRAEANLSLCRGVSANNNPAGALTFRIFGCSGL